MSGLTRGSKCMALDSIGMRDIILGCGLSGDALPSSFGFQVLLWLFLVAVFFACVIASTWTAMSIRRWCIALLGGKALKQAPT